MSSAYLLSSSSKSRREGIDPRLIEIDDLAITLTLIDFGHPAHAGLRTAEVQHSLFHEGSSKADGYKSKSEHQSGNALDFYAYVEGKVSYKESHMAIVALAYFKAANILGYKIDWGGLWKRRTPKFIDGIPYGWDMPHIQILN